MRSAFGAILPMAEPASTIVSGHDDTAQRRRLAAAPDRAGLAAALGKALDQGVHARLVGKPAGVAHRGVHRHRDRQRAAGDEVVDDRRDRIDRDLAVETAARRGVVRRRPRGSWCRGPPRRGRGSGRRPRSGRRSRRGSSPARRSRGPPSAGRGARRALAGALERIELVVADAGGFVGRDMGGIGD
jgi:hypothetical protein